VVQDSESKIILYVIPKFEDLIDIDAEKKDIKKTIEKLDKMPSEMIYKTYLIY